jgi:hypothetical protein
VPATFLSAASNRPGLSRPHSIAASVIKALREAISFLIAVEIISVEIASISLLELEQIIYLQALT